MQNHESDDIVSHTAASDMNYCCCSGEGKLETYSTAWGILCQICSVLEIELGSVALSTSEFSLAELSLTDSSLPPRSPRCR